MTPVPRSFRFGHSHRLHGRVAFATVFEPRVKKSLGPVTLFGKPNGLPHCRLGLSVPRRVGTAVQRNRIKRLIREAFRLGQHDLQPGYDVIVVVRPHAPASVGDYQEWLLSGIGSLHREWLRRQKRAKADEGGTPPTTANP